MYRLCKSCRKRFEVDPRVPNQQFCSKSDCQKERRRRWINQKRSNDSDYKENQVEAQKSWIRKNPAYWRRYREKNPEYAERNRTAQKARNASRKTKPLQAAIAKIDESTGYNVINTGLFRIPVRIENIAKIDAILVRIDIISGPKQE